MIPFIINICVIVLIWGLIFGILLFVLLNKPNCKPPKEPDEERLRAEAELDGVPFVTKDTNQDVLKRAAELRRIAETNRSNIQKAKIDNYIRIIRNELSWAIQQGETQRAIQGRCADGPQLMELLNTSFPEWEIKPARDPSSTDLVFSLKK